MFAKKYCRQCAIADRNDDMFLRKLSTELLVTIQTYLTSYEIYCLHFAIYTNRGIDYENKLKLSFGPINFPIYITTIVHGQVEDITISRSLLWSLLSNTMIKSLKVYINLSENVFRETVLFVKKLADLVRDGYLNHAEELFIKVNADSDFSMEEGGNKFQYSRQFQESVKQLNEALATKPLVNLKCFGIEIDCISYPMNESVVNNLRLHSPLLQKLEGFSHFLEADFSSFLNLKNTNWVSLTELDLGELIHRRCRLNEYISPLPDDNDSLHSAVQGIVAALSFDNFPKLTTLKISATCVEDMFTIFEALIDSIKTGHFSAHKNIKTLLVDIDKIDPRMHLEIQDSYQNLGSGKDNLLFPSLNNFICNNWLPSAHLFKFIAFENSSTANKLVISPGLEDCAFSTYMESYTWSIIPAMLILKAREYNPHGAVHGISNNALSHASYSLAVKSFRLKSEYPTSGDDIFNTDCYDDTVSRALYRSVLCDRLSNLYILGFTTTFLYYMYTLDIRHSFKISRNNSRQMNQSVHQLVAHCPILHCIKLDMAPIPHSKYPDQTVIISFFSALNECMILMNRNMQVEVTMTDDMIYRELLVIINSHRNEMNRINVSLVLDVSRIFIV